MASATAANSDVVPIGSGRGCTLAAYATKKRLPPEFLREKFGLRDYVSFGTPAIEMPYRDTDGNVVAVRYRRSLEETGKKRFAWREGDKTLPYSLDHLRAAREAGAKVAIIVEGESDTQTLVLAGFAAMGLPGAGVWNDEWAAHLDGFEAVYAIQEPGDAGANFIKRLARSPIASRLRVVRLDPFKDPSAMYLDNPDGFADAMRAAMEQVEAVVVEAVAAPLVLAHGSDVEIAQRLVERLAREHGEEAVVHSNGLFWAFQGTHWAEIDDNRLRRLAHEFDGMPIETGRPIRLNKARIDSIVNEAAVMLDRTGFFDNPAIGINCASGFIAIGHDCTPAVLPHHAEQRQRHVLPGRWMEDSAAWTDPAGPDGTLLARFLEGCFRDDPDALAKMATLQEVAGAVILGLGTQIPSPKALILFGASAENGKSQFLDLLRGVVPDDAVASVSPCKMADPTYLAQLDSTLLNASDEMSSAKSIASDHFKAVITGDPLMAHRKYKDPKSFRCRAQHVFATNDLPHFEGGMDRGVRRRLLVIEFKRTIPPTERVSDIGKRVAMEEADILLAWAVAGARRLLAARRYTEPPTSVEVLNDWVIGSNPVLAWMEERVEVRDGDPRPWTLVKLAYADFKEWAAAMGFPEHRLPTQNVFAQRVRATGKGIDRSRRSDGAVFLGLVLHYA